MLVIHFLSAFEAAFTAGLSRKHTWVCSNLFSDWSPDGDLVYLPKYPFSILLKDCKRLVPNFLVNSAFLRGAFHGWNIPPRLQGQNVAKRVRNAFLNYYDDNRCKKQPPKNNMRAPRDSNPQPQSYSCNAVGGPRATTGEIVSTSQNARKPGEADLRQAPNQDSVWTETLAVVLIAIC